jgi:hypothetical protein
LEAVDAGQSQADVDPVERLNFGNVSHLIDDGFEDGRHAGLADRVQV